LTIGNDPDGDGYELTVDGGSSTPLSPNDSAEVELPAGAHTLHLLGAADHCSISPRPPLTVDIAPRSTTPVAFEVSCQATGASVTVTTTGLDVDTDGYRVTVEGIDRGAISTNGTMLIRLDPGSRSFALTGLLASCAVDGTGSRLVTIVDGDVARVDFTVVCTARTGVIGISVEASGSDVDGGYGVSVDGAPEFSIELGGPAYVRDVRAGDHTVSLDAPPNCTVENGPQSIAVSTGGLVRDTVTVTFSVTCTEVDGNVRITAPTTGVVPPSTLYRVMHESFSYWDYPVGALTELGVLEPNDALVANLGIYESGANYWHVFSLQGVPSGCSVSNPDPRPNFGFAIPEDGVLEIEFKVACPS
jgi:hypothetical protein